MRGLFPKVKLILICIIAVLFYVMLGAEIIPDITASLSTMYLLTLAVIAFEYVSHHITPRERIRHTIQQLMSMGLLLLLLRGLKYIAFKETDVLARYTWYFYYVPVLFMPLLLFFLCKLTFTKEASLPRLYRAMTVFTAALAAVIITNDLHQQVFRFKPGFLNWDGDYSYGPVFYIVCVWQYSLYLIASIGLVVQCTVKSAR